MRRQLIYNNIASGGSIFWRIIVQLMVAPLLLTIWGTDQYGKWLLITSIPMFLAVVDLGLTDAASAEMTMEIAKGNRIRAQAIFLSILMLTVMIVLVFCSLSAAVLIAGDVYIGQIHLTHDDVIVVYEFILYSGLLIISRLFLGALKAGGYYAISTLIYDAIQFLESLSLVITAFVGGSLFLCAVGFLVLRSVNIVVLVTLQKRMMSWLTFDLGSASVTEIRRLFVPGVAALAIPIALALNFQGMVWIGGALLGPTAAAILATVRTGARVIIQLIGIFTRAAMPIYSVSVATDNRSAQCAIQRINTYLTVLLLVPGCALFAVFGQELIQLWTSGNICADHTFLALMAAATAFHGAWYYRFNLMLAINRHTRFAGILIILTLAALVVGFIMATRFALNGIGVTLVLLEALSLLGLIFCSVRRSTPAILSKKKIKAMTPM